MKIAEAKVQSVEPDAWIFVPAQAVERAGRRNVVLGGESFYSPAEMLAKEAATNGTHERENL
jgi:hypothetical protein